MVLRKIGANLRVVGALGAGGVEVDPEVALGDHLAEQHLGHARCERAAAAARETAVEVAAVRQPAVENEKAGNVGDRDGDDRSGKLRERAFVEQPAQDADADQLVAVHGGGDEDRRPGAAAHHREGNGHRLRRVGLGDLELEVDGLPLADQGAGETQGRPRARGPTLSSPADARHRPARSAGAASSTTAAVSRGHAETRAERSR